MASYNVKKLNFAVGEDEYLLDNDTDIKALNAKVSTLDYSKTLSSSDDLNTIPNGTYNIVAGSIPANCPVSNNAIVETVGVGQRFQTVISATSGVVYTYQRRYYQSWGNWEQLALNSKVKTITSEYLADFDLGSTITWSELISRRTVTFFTSWHDSTNVPSRYGSGYLIPGLDGNNKYLYYQRTDRAWYRSITGSTDSGWCEIALKSEITAQTQYANDQTKGMPATAGTGVTIDTTKAYTRAVKRNGIVYLQLRMQIPSGISDDTVIATLHSDLKPIVDMSYLPCFNLWDRTISGCMTVSSTDGNIRANHDCAGKNLSLIITYPALNY